MELQELRVDALFLCELLSFDMEGHNRHFTGDTICHDLTARLDKITYILIRLCTVIEFALNFDPI